MLETLLKAIGVITMDERQRVLYSQKQAIRKAADKLNEIAESIERDYNNMPGWAEVDKYWVAVDFADEINDTL